MDLMVTGAITGKIIHIPADNYGMSMEMYSYQIENGSKKGYPKKFTRISFKSELADGTKFADCHETVEELITQLQIN